MLEENKALLRRWFEEVWNKRRTEAIDEMFAADGIAHGLSDDEDQPVSSRFMKSFAAHFLTSRWWRKT